MQALSSTARGSADGFEAVFAGVEGGFGAGADFFGALADFRAGLLDFLHRGGDFLDRGGLFLGAGGLFLNRGADFADGGGEEFGTLADFFDLGTQAAPHGIEGGGEDFDFVTGCRDIGFGSEVALGDAGREPGEGGERFGNAAHKACGNHESRPENHRAGDNEQDHQVPFGCQQIRSILGDKAQQYPIKFLEAPHQDVAGLVASRMGLVPRGRGEQGGRVCLKGAVNLRQLFDTEGVRFGGIHMALGLFLGDASCDHLAELAGFLRFVDEELGGEAGLAEPCRGIGGGLGNEVVGDLLLEEDGGLGAPVGGECGDLGLSEDAQLVAGAVDVPDGVADDREEGDADSGEEPIEFASDGGAGRACFLVHKCWGLAMSGDSANWGRSSRKVLSPMGKSAPGQPGVIAARADGGGVAAKPTGAPHHRANVRPPAEHTAAWVGPHPGSFSPSSRNRENKS